MVTIAVGSVLEQTYKDYEIIVVDDGSTDDTAVRLRRYGDRIRYCYQENRGASAAQNKGIELSKGQWIAILASDDTWSPRKLELQIEALGKMGSKFGACFTDCKYIGDSDLKLTVFEEAGLRTEAEYGPLDDPIKYLLGKHALIFVQSLLVRRSLVEGDSGFDLNLVVSEDTDLIFRLASRTRFCYVNLPLVKVDRTPGRKDRLTCLFTDEAEKACSISEYRLQKWLRLAKEQGDIEVYRRISDSQRELYYHWLIIGLRRRRYGSVVLPLVRKIRSTGDDYGTICARVLDRGVRKLARLAAVRKYHR